ncbi:MAG: pseudaminic acid cytidylyltransferase [bacterium]|nr:pseudaminic acid cytidylyltransferase [bacterium]
MSPKTGSVAIIPARGGSKRIPRKNIRPISGKPLLWWSVQTCLASGAFDDVVVSTDDEEIAGIARDSGASVPFIRPADLAGDMTATVDVISHAVSWLVENDRAVQAACCVYPASVFLRGEDYSRSRALLDRAEYVATVTRYPYPVQRALTMGLGGTLAFAHPEYAGSRTQDLDERWHDAGQFYWGTARAWLDRLSILDNAVGYAVDGSLVCDIDTEEDWRRAEQLHRILLEQSTVQPPAVG